MSIFNNWSGDKDEKESKAGKKTKATVKAAPKKVKAIVDAEVTENEESKTLAPAKNIKFNAFRVLSKPVVTEKSTYLVNNNTYCFNVAIHTNKIEIKKAVEAVYGVKVANVRVLNKVGKIVTFGRITGKRKANKKAYVTLAKGQQIEIHKNV